MKEQTIDLWTPEREFPQLDYIPMPDVMTHVVVNRACEGVYHYLHETSLSWHQGQLYVAWANSGEKETNTSEEVVRYAVSADGESFSEPKLMGEASPDECRNHSVMVSTGQSLWCFLTRHDDGKLSGMEAFEFDEAANQWRGRGLQLEGFIPFDRPKRLDNGNWVIAGETGFQGEMAIAISQGGDLSQWRLVVIGAPSEKRLRFPETTVLIDGATLTAVSRFEEVGQPWHLPGGESPYLRAIASVSGDYGENWSEVRPTNLPMQPSKPFAGSLDDGRQYLIFNAANPEAPSREMLVIAISPPGLPRFSKVYRIHRGPPPSHPFFRNLQWSYPSAVEHEGRLYITYSVNKSDCGMTVIPVRCL